MKQNRKLFVLPLLCLVSLTGCNKETPHVHTYNMDEISWMWPSEIEVGETVTATVTCSTCKEGVEGHEKTFDAPILMNGKTDSTCIEKGHMTYRAIFSYQDVSYHDDKIVELDYAPHSFSSSWSYDDSYHYHVCTNEGCTATDEKIAHDYTEEVVSEEYLASEATCLSAPTYYKSCICGAKSETETFTYGELGNHLVRHYTRLEATATEPGCKEYFICEYCQQLTAYDENEFSVKYTYGDAKTLQMKITTGQKAKCNFLSTDTGFLMKEETAHTVGWYSTAEEGTYFAAVFNENFKEGETFSLKKGSYITGTDEQTYLLNKDYTFTYLGDGSGWEMNTQTDVPGLADSWVEGGVASPVSDPNDPRFIPAFPTEISLTLGWNDSANVQLTSSASIENLKDGDRLTVMNADSYLETNIVSLGNSLRYWTNTIIGLDTVNLGSGASDNHYVYFKAGLLLLDKTGTYYQLTSDILFVYRNGTWQSVDTSIGMIESASPVLISGTTAYLSLTGTNLMTYAEGTNLGGMVPSQAQYEGSIQFCNVEFNDLGTYSSTLHLFATMNGAAWNDSTLRFRIYDSDKWVSQGYNHITDFAKYDFGVSEITLSIKSGTIIKITEGGGGTYFVKNDIQLAYSNGSWVKA